MSHHPKQENDEHLGYILNESETDPIETADNEALIDLLEDIKQIAQHIIERIK